MKVEPRHTGVIDIPLLEADLRVWLSGKTDRRPEQLSNAVLLITRNSDGKTLRVKPEDYTILVAATPDIQIKPVEKSLAERRAELFGEANAHPPAPMQPEDARANMGLKRALDGDHIRLKPEDVGVS